MSLVVSLPRSECEFEPSSVMDAVGRVFQFQGRILRGIFPEHCEFMLDTLELSEREKLFDLGLIPGWRTEYTLPEFPLIIEHLRVPFVTLRCEWSGEGLRAAALCCLRVAARLAEADRCLKDAHTWNVLFDGRRPYVIDWGSIRPISELDWDFWYLQFRKYFLVPLYLISLGETRLARALMREHIIGVGNYLLDLSWTKRIPEQSYQVYEKRSQLSPRAVYEALADYVSSLSFPRVGGEWLDYEQPLFTTVADMEHARPKEAILHRLMASDPGSTVLDFGCSYGLHSEMFSAMGKSVLAADIEETCLNELFLKSRGAEKDILVLYLDFLWPEGESGIMNVIPSASRRLTCDTVVVLALVHHLVFKQHVHFDSIARNIASFTRSRAVVEFVPPDDFHVAQWAPERLPWYRLDNFVDSMMQYFCGYTLHGGDPEPRKMLIFEGKKSA